MNLFRIRGIQLAVHGSFFLLLLFVAQDGWRAEENGGWPGLVLSTGLLLAFFACVVLHELGHSFTAMAYGIGVRRILLMPIGGMAEMDDIPRQPSRELLITLAGPAVNFLIAAVLWIVLRTVPFSDNLDPVFSWPAFVFELLRMNIWMGLFNLLPAFPMDGGRILRAILATRMRYLRATFWAATIGKCVAVVCALVAILIFQTWMPVLLFAFIFYVGEMEYRAVQRRELEDAHWRAVLARAYAGTVPPPAEEPPVLVR